MVDGKKVTWKSVVISKAKGTTVKGKVVSHRSTGLLRAEAAKKPVEEKEPAESTAESFLRMSKDLDFDKWAKRIIDEI